MKKYFIIALILLAHTTWAQWQVGGKASITFANYKSKTPWKEVANSGFAFGAVAYKQLNANLGINFQLEYIQKGYFHKICNTIYDKLEATYIEMPVMVDYSFMLPFKNFKGHVQAGLYAAYWLDAKYKTEGFDDTGETFDFKKNNATRFDAGPGVGARIEYLLPRGSLSLDLRYEIGIADLQKTEGDNTNNNNRVLVVGISYLKPLGR